MQGIWFIYIISALLFSACSSKIDPNTLNTYVAPSWYLQTPVSLENTIFGYGEGETPALAKKDALGNLVSNISVNVETTQTIEKTHETHNSYETLQSNHSVKTVLKTHDVNLVGVRIVKKEAYHGHYYVLISLNKAHLFNHEKSQFISAYDALILAYEQAKLKSIYVQLKWLMEQQETVTHLEQRLALLQALNDHYDFSENYHTLQTIKNASHELRERFNIRIIAENPKFQNACSTLIHRAGYHIGHKASDLTIQISNSVSEVKSSEFSQWHIVKVTSNIRVFENEKQLVNSLQVNTIGRSVNSYEDAIAEASRVFSKKLSEHTVNALLFGTV